MDREKEEALEGIERALAWVREERGKSWAPLSDRYLKHLEHVEALPQNQSGSDKSAAWKVVETARQHFASARRRR